MAAGTRALAFELSADIHHPIPTLTVEAYGHASLLALSPQVVMSAARGPSGS